jgi:hypothetical protein
MGGTITRCNETGREIALSHQVERLKLIIKSCDICGIVDGNDMCDWGWMTIQDHNAQIRAIKLENKRLRDLLASAGVVDPEAGKFRMSGWNP